MQDEGCLVLQGVDGVDDVIVGIQGEIRGVGVREPRLNGLDRGFGIDFQEHFLEHVHFGPADGMDRRHPLAVDVGGGDAVGVDQGQMPDAGPDESFRAPAADTTHAEEDDADLGEALHHVGAEQQFGPVEELSGVHRASQPSRRSRTSRQTVSRPISLRISWRILG